MAEVLTRTSEVMPKISDPSSSYLSIKELLISPSWKYCHKCPSRKHCDSLTDIVIYSENKPKSFNISGAALFHLLFVLYLSLLYLIDVLLYLYDSFLPFLQVLYGEVYNRDHDTKLKKQACGKFTDDIYAALIVCGNYSLNYVAVAISCIT